MVNQDKNHLKKIYKKQKTNYKKQKLNYKKKNTFKLARIKSDGPKPVNSEGKVRLITLAIFLLNY